MSIEAVIEAATIVPATAIGWADRIGTLGVGRCADIAVPPQPCHRWSSSPFHR